jgi:RecB family exonuclease
MAASILWLIADWARAIAALPVEGELPSRAVLVPRERIAHGLRRELARIDRADALTGTLFANPLTLACDVLVNAGVRFDLGEGALRRVRLLRLFETDLPLKYFDREQLRSAPGWDEAFARTLADLEGAGIRPDGLPQVEGPWSDVATIWTALDQSAGESWSSQRVLLKAAEVLEGSPETWTIDGPTLSAVTGQESTALARFVCAIPRVQIALVGVRPVRSRHLERVKALFGAEHSHSLASSLPPQANGSERDLLSRFLFATPEELARPGRERSAGPDGSVRLETHAGVDAELEATADWVGRQVLAGTPLEEIAVLIADGEARVDLTVQRLARLPWADGTLPVHVPGGLPADTHGAGARALATVRALAGHLPIAALAELVPTIRLQWPDSTEGEDERPNHLFRGRAVEIVSGLGTAGGNAELPAGALEWYPRLKARVTELEADPKAAQSSAKPSHDARLLRDLNALAPGIEALVRVAEHIVADRPLGEVWGALRTFLADWMLDPSPGPEFASLLGGAIEPLCASSGCEVRGDEALRAIEEAVHGLRAPQGRYGTPAVFVGTLAAAAGLSFQAVRIIGLSEGTVPPSHREDPVLPDRLRSLLPLLPRTEDRILERLHLFHRAVRGASREVVLSAPLVDFAGTERQPSSVFIEAAAAIARPRPGGGTASAVPHLGDLERDAFGPARADAAAFRSMRPLSQAAWVDHAARGRGLPCSWQSQSCLDLCRMRDCRDGEAMLGLAPGGMFPEVPGMSAEIPISATALVTLLDCPHRFLLQRVFGWDEPAATPELRQIDALSYGSLLHLVAERFARSHGAAFVAHGSRLEQWRKVGDSLCEESFAEFLRQYPLAGESVRHQELTRLKKDFRNFLEYDWKHSKGAQTCRFVDAERRFGFDEPLRLSVDGPSLYVRGSIDRIDRSGRSTVVRDLKTGRSHPRTGDEIGPTPARDVQIALYGLVAEQLAREWKTTEEIEAAYVYVSGRGDEERAFRDDYGALKDAARSWLTVAHDLLRSRLFPRTPDCDDCGFCPFAPLCSSHQLAATEGALEDAVGMSPLRKFLALKRPEPSEDALDEEDCDDSVEDAS